jgi:putative SOS response-associated peptidase YedK
MCGRFTHRYTWSEIHALYRLTTPPANLQPRYNVCPTTTINTVVAGDGENELVPTRWGLIPWWWKKKAKEIPATFNARAETAAKKPMFRSAFEGRRCLIPASGYYEWRDTPGGRQPRRDEQPITIAGLWDEWKDIETGDWVKSCTMIITDANEFVREIHDRMPVILEAGNFDSWLDRSAGAELLKPAANDVLQEWPVSKRVNSSRTGDEDATPIDPIELAVAN